MKEINVIGGGLAGVEAAWQAARVGRELMGWQYLEVGQDLRIKKGNYIRDFSSQGRSTSNSP